MQLDPASGWCQDVRHCPSPNFNQRPAEEISLLVIHNISLPPGQFATGKVQEFFQNRLDVTEHSYFEGIADLRVSGTYLAIASHDSREASPARRCFAAVVEGHFQVCQSLKLLIVRCTRTVQSRKAICPSY